MAQEIQETIITDSDLAFGEGPNFPPDNPIGGTINVTAHDSEGNARTFCVPMVDGFHDSFDPVRDHFKSVNTNDNQKEPEFNYYEIIGAANEYMDGAYRLSDTGYQTQEGLTIRILATPFNVHVLPDNHAYDEQFSSEGRRFLTPIETFETYKEAEEYIAARGDQLNHYSIQGIPLDME